MFRLKDVKKTYVSKKASNTVALDGVTLDFPNKGLTFIVGESGSGKSTLLNVLGGLDSIDSGNIIFNDKDIASFSEKEMDSYRNTCVGFIFQDYNLLEGYNVYENIQLALNLQMSEDNDKKIDKLLEDVGLKGLGNRRINELSGGQKQRVAIARALIKNPSVILADEPTGNLDSKSSEQIFKLLKEISKTRLVIVVSHNNEAAKNYGDRSIKLADGVVASDNYKKEKLVTEDVIYRDSKLLNKDAFRLCMMNIGRKKGRFILTIILSMFAILFMVVTFNVFIYDNNAHKLDTLVKNDEYYININKSECISDSGYIYCSRVTMNDEELNTLIKDNSLSKGIMYSLRDSEKDIAFKYGPIERKDISESFFGKQNEPYIVEILDEEILGDLVGRAPKNHDEVVISEGIADLILFAGIEDSNGNLYKPNSFEELLEHDATYILAGYPVKIVGISLVSNDDVFSDFKKTNSTFENGISLSDYYLDDVYWTTYIYVKGLVEKLDLTYSDEAILEQFYIFTDYYSVQKSGYLTEEITYYDFDGKHVTDKLNYDEIIISIEHVGANTFTTEYSEFLKEHPEYSYEEGKKAYVEEVVVGKRFKDAKTVIDYYDYFQFKEGYELKHMKIVGVTDSDTTYFSPSLKDYLEDPTRLVYGLRLYSEEKDELKDVIDSYVGFLDIETLGTHFSIEHRYDENIFDIKTLYDVIHNYLAVITVIFIIFMVLLLYNFINATIASGKKEIGILRALGASNKDVMKIFGYESLILGSVGWIFGFILFLIFTVLINKSPAFTVLYGVDVVMINILSLIFSAIFTLVMSILLSILSISRVSKIKPIDAILDK